MSSEKEDAPPPRKLACTKYFDALYFCYSPVYQMQQYYRLGDLDDCFGKWKDLFDCLYLKTKRKAEVEVVKFTRVKIDRLSVMDGMSNDQKILESREKAQHHIWTFRTPKEGERFWKKHYGHLDDQP